MNLPTQIQKIEPPPPQNSQIAQAETATAAFAAQQKALVESRYIIALQRPRDWDLVRSKMLKDAKRPSFAAVARYHKPIGKGVEGPSIRFVEAALRNMGNLITETNTLFDDAEKRIVRVTVTDFESNVIYSQDVTITKTVERKSLKQGDTPISSRLNSYGQMTYLLPATDDDILNKQNALISKAVRTLGLRVIPGDLVDEAMRVVLDTQSKEDARDPDTAKRNLLDSFASVGVSATHIKEYLGHNAAIKEGETTWKAIQDSIDSDIKTKTTTTEEKPTSLKGALSKSVKQPQTQKTSLKKEDDDDNLFG